MASPVVVVDLDEDSHPRIMLRGEEVGTVYRAPGQHHHGLVELIQHDYKPEDLIAIGQTIVEVLKEWDQ